MIREFIRNWLGVTDIETRVTALEPKKRGPKKNKVPNAPQPQGTRTTSAKKPGEEEL